jgi:hypothetical protein
LGELVHDGAGAACDLGLVKGAIDAHAVLLDQIAVTVDVDARAALPVGADDAEDVLGELAGEACFESCRSYIRSSGAVRSWPSLKRWRGERRRRVVTSSDRQRGSCEGPATDCGLLAAVLECPQSDIMEIGLEALER